MDRAPARLILLGILALALAARLSVWSRVFDAGRVDLDGPDAYYHLRRAALTMEHWPRVPQFDPALNYPAGGRISWPPLFDGLLATLALPWRTDRALEIIGALLPPLLGVAQVAVLFALVRRLRNERAALIAAAVAAILPAAVRYTLVGALDHDPFFTLCFLASLLGLAAESAPLVALSLACGNLGWAGAPVQVATVTLVVIAVRRPGASRALAIGATVAAIAIVPFVATSTWHGATFEGLSWLHVTALAAAGITGAALARNRALLVVNAVALLALLPISIRPMISGARYAAGDAPILALVAETQPLLRLFGRFDVWPMLIRFGLLPLIAVVGIPVMLLRRSKDALFITPWVAVMLTLALLHSRFSFDAALALSAFAGIAFDRLTRVGLALAAALLTILPAYVPLPQWEGFNFYLRENALHEYEMDRVCDWLRRAPPGGVLSPWAFGHWIVWLGRKPVVIGPMLSVGQSEFSEGMRFSFLEDPRSATAFLQSHGVRYVVVTPELNSIAARARIAGLDPARYRSPALYARTVGARLTFFGPIDGTREVLHSRAYVPTPFGVVPLVRVYEVAPATAAAPPRGTG